MGGVRESPCCSLHQLYNSKTFAVLDTFGLPAQVSEYRASLVCIHPRASGAALGHLVMSVVYAANAQCTGVKSLPYPFIGLILPVLWRRARPVAFDATASFPTRDLCLASKPQSFHVSTAVHQPCWYRRMLNLCIDVWPARSNFQALKLSAFQRLSSALAPLSAPQIKASTFVLRLCILFLYIYRRSPRQWLALATWPCSRAAGPTLRWRRRVSNGAPACAPESSCALLHARFQCRWRHGCLLSGLESRAAATSRPDRTTSSKMRHCWTSSRRRWRPRGFGWFWDNIPSR